MNAADYMKALHAAGIPRGLPAHELDRQAAALLKIDERTARRYRRGEGASIPGPVKVALTAITALRRTTEDPR